MKLRIEFKPNNGNDHRAAAKDVVPKSRAARGSVCNVLLSRVTHSNLKCNDQDPIGVFSHFTQLSMPGKTFVKTAKVRSG